MQIMAQKSYRTWLLSLAMLGALLDQTSKYTVFHWLYQHPTRFDARADSGSFEIVPGAFRLYAQFTPHPVRHPILHWGTDRLPRVNHGALFGIGNDDNDRKDSGANTLFAGVSVLAGLAIVGWSFRRSAAGDRLLCAALGLILAGTIGNLYDRLVFGGVRDFLFFYAIDWPVFNVADCCLVLGAVALLAHAFLTRPAAAPVASSVQIESASVPAPEIAPVK
jgi:lipoprotein signal peptidase